MGELVEFPGRPATAAKTYEAVVPAGIFERLAQAAAAGEVISLALVAVLKEGTVLRLDSCIGNDPLRLLGGLNRLNAVINANLDDGADEQSLGLDDNGEIR